MSCATAAVESSRPFPRELLRQVDIACASKPATDLTTPRSPRESSASGSSGLGNPLARPIRFGLDALRCPRCGTTLRRVAAIEDPAVALKILACLDLPARALPLSPASGKRGWQESGAWDADAACPFDPTPPDDDGMAWLHRPATPTPPIA